MRFSPHDIRVMSRGSVAMQRAKIMRTFDQWIESKLQHTTLRVSRVANKTVAYMKRSIRAGILKVPPLTEARTTYKGHDLPLVDTGEYVDAIVAVEIRPGLFRITVRDGMHSSGISLAHLSRVLEYGSFAAGIPARPHFAPARDYARRLLRSV